MRFNSGFKGLRNGYKAREKDIRNAHNILPGKLKRSDQFER